MRTQTCVHIISKNEIVREGLKRILVERGFEVVAGTFDGEASNTSEPVDLTIVDAVSLSDGLAACVAEHERRPDTRIVLMMDEYRLDQVSQAFATGAVDGYLIKAISCEPLAGALRLIAMGEKLLPSQAVEAFTSQGLHPMPHGWDASCTDHNLSAREREILRCLIDGDANKVISRRLGVTDATVKVHIKAILRKLHVKNRTQAAIWAISRGVLHTPESSADPRIGGTEEPKTQAQLH